MPRLHLLLPERDRLEAALPPESLSALDRFVRRGDRVPDAPRAPEFSGAPMGAISRQQDVGDAADADWARLTPVALQPDLAGVGLVGLPELDESDADSLWGLADEVLAPFGWRCLADPHGGAWLRAEQALQLEALPPDAVLGCDLGDCQPAGEDARRWRQASGTLEIELHHAAFNQARRGRGEPMVNAVWVWGCGSLPEAPSRGGREVWLSDDPWRCRLARWEGFEDCPLQAPRPAGDDEGALWVSLDSAAGADPLRAWLQALPTLLREGVTLHFDQEPPIRLGGWQRWRFWR